MIDRSLPPVRRGNPGDYGEIAEALALSYLAQYSSIAPTLRQTQSYSRAWGFDQLKFFPRVPGGRPGYLMAIYNSDDTNKVIIAIEGLTSSAQLMVLVGQGLNANQVGTLPGRVCTVYDVHSGTIMAEILADADFIAATNHRRHTLTLTGFSLGAAVAEVLAAKMQAADATRRITLRKFASPRVGNRAWVEGLDARIEKDSRFAGRDPIHTYPQVMFSRGLGALVTGAVYTFIVPDRSPLAWNGDGLGGLGAPNIPGTIDANRYLLALTLPINTINIWWWHEAATYRWLMQHLLYNQGRGLNYYRFAYLEHADENQWQARFQAGASWDATFLTLGVPPADAVIPPAFDQRIEQLDRDTSGTSEGEDWGGEDTGNTVAGGNWGYSSPTQRVRHRVPH